jgi:L-seryl-tRNA(Ser) seleniumtransferase
MNEALRELPPVYELVERVVRDRAANGAPRAVVTDAARAVLDEERREITGGARAAAATIELLVRRVAAHLARAERSPLRPVINATGVVIHTGLGRAPWPAAAVRAATEAAQRYANVEIDLATGERGRRSDHVRDLLRALTGAEAATVVNNNAAATLLTVTALAAGRSVIVSRGELVEIGGSFRLPEVMAAGGARLVEVGTTNRTRLGDYRRAIDESTALIMKVHTSNYRITGFTESVPIDELVRLGRERGIPVVDDIGSGALRDTADYGIVSAEPTAAGSIAAGADVVLFSGDKLLGGPQAGIVLGRGDIVARIEGHPMMRAMRVDKVTLAGLAATLRLHRDLETARRDVPVLAMITAPPGPIEARARAIADRLRGAPGVERADVRASIAHIGGGSIPEQELPSSAVVMRAARCSEDELAARLRGGDVPVLPRVADGAVWLDLRTVLPDQDDALASAVRAAAAPERGV